MKYTNYVINGNIIDGKQLERLPKIMLPLSISVAIVGVVLLAGVLPLTLIMDGSRSLKYQMIKLERKYYYGQSIVQNKAFRFVVVQPVKVIVIKPIHNVLRFVA